MVYVDYLRGFGTSPSQPRILVFESIMAARIWGTIASSTIQESIKMGRLITFYSLGFIMNLSKADAID